MERQSEKWVIEKYILGKKNEGNGRGSTNMCLSSSSFCVVYLPNIIFREKDRQEGMEVPREATK